MSKQRAGVHADYESADPTQADIPSTNQSVQYCIFRGRVQYKANTEEATAVEELVEQKSKQYLALAKIII
jgi:hypothetical protein